MHNIKLNFNWFFLTAATASYLLGVTIARFSGRQIDFFNLLSGLVIFFALYLLQVVQRYLTSNRVNPFTRVRTNGQNRSSVPLTMIFIAFFAIFGGLYVLLQAEVLIGTNLLLLTLLTVVLFLSMGRFSRLWFDSMAWLFEGFVVAPIMFFLGPAIQEFQFFPLMILLCLPLFFLYAASAITLVFSEYDQNSSTRSNSFLASVGWEKALKFHHVLIILTYVALLIYLAMSNSWSRNWPVLLLSLISGVEVYFLEQMAGGMRPNWQFIRAIAVVQFFSLVYLLTYPLLIQ